MLIQNQTRMERVFNDLLEILNFCKNANTQPLIELAISRTENAIEALFQTLEIIIRDDRVNNVPEYMFGL